MRRRRTRGFKREGHGQRRPEGPGEGGFNTPCELCEQRSFVAAVPGSPAAQGGTGSDAQERLEQCNLRRLREDPVQFLEILLGRHPGRSLGVLLHLLHLGGTGNDG